MAESQVNEVALKYMVEDDSVKQTNRYKAYPEYKDSGVEWLGEIPPHWKISKLRYMFDFGSGLNITKANLKDTGIPCINYGEVHSKFGFEVDTERHGLKCVDEKYLISNPSALLNKGDLVFADTSEDIEGSGNFTQLISDKLAFAGYHTVIARPNNDDCSRFYAYLLDSKEIRTQIRHIVKGVKVFTISQSILKGVNIWLPSLEERQSIASFLDHETAKIDTLIEKQQRLIELLTEKRQAVISHAVTKGLNPDVPMKDSGVEWLGEVPEHWEVKEIKFHLKSLNSRRIPLNSQDRGDREGVYRYYGASGVIDYIDDYIFDESTVLVGEDGANLLSRSTPLAFSVHGKYWVNNHAHILEVKDGLADFWAEVIDIIDVTPIVTGSAQPKLTAEALSNLKIAFPPTVQERKEIENFIHLSKNKYGKLIKKAQNAIQLMQERRTALISAAVTGKIDVRDWENSNPIKND